MQIATASRLSSCWPVSRRGAQLNNLAVAKSALSAKQCPSSATLCNKLQAQLQAPKRPFSSSSESGARAAKRSVCGTFAGLRDTGHSARWRALAARRTKVGSRARDSLSNWPIALVGHVSNETATNLRRDSSAHEPICARDTQRALGAIEQRSSGRRAIDCRPPLDELAA